MGESAIDRVGAMLNPPHLGELIRESMDEVGWNVTKTAGRLGCERGTLSRLLNGKTGVSANMALALENIGWGTADHWMRMQAATNLPRRGGAGRLLEAAFRCRTHEPASLSRIASRRKGPLDSPEWNAVLREWIQGRG